VERFEATIAYWRSARAVPHPLSGRPFSEGELHAINSPLTLVKTIEMILGAPPMSIFDMIANDMRASLQPKPDLTPYEAIVPTQSIYELNPGPNALVGQKRLDAIASSKMDWQEPDEVPTEKLNRILWRNAMGTESPIWKQGSGVFHSEATQ
jgi:hypothetical protein